MMSDAAASNAVLFAAIAYDCEANPVPTADGRKNGKARLFTVAIPTIRLLLTSEKC